jgi:hypothetical protein
MQFVKCNVSALEKGLCIGCWFASTWTAIEKAYANDAFEVGDRI